MGDHVVRLGTRLATKLDSDLVGPCTLTRAPSLTKRCGFVDQIRHYGPRGGRKVASFLVSNPAFLKQIIKGTN